jgi:hypothetical protein
MAICVVMGHCFFRINGWHHDQLAEQGMGSNVVSELILSSRIFVLFVVALFFLVSGYLFFIHLEQWDSKEWKRKMMRRIGTLLIPYLLWNTIYIIYRIGPVLWGCLFHGNSWEEVNAWANANGGWWSLYWNARVLGMGQVDLWGNPAHTTTPILLPFYFIRELIVLTLFTPLFHFLLRSRNDKISPYAIVTLVVLAFLYLTQTSFVIPGFTAESFFYFGWGAFLSLNRLELSEVFYARRWPIAIVTLCLFLVMLYNGYLYSQVGRIVYPFFTVVEVMAIINMASWIVKRSHSSERFAALKEGVTSWQGATFMIFALHFFFRQEVFNVLNRIGGALTGFYDVKMMEMANQFPYIVLLNFLSRIIIISLLCMIVYRLLDRFLPRCCRILCGR